MIDNNSNSFTVAFYNIENLFDLENDLLTNDDDFFRPQQNNGLQSAVIISS